MTIDIKELLKAGGHFGHQKHKWNPKMAPFIFTERNGIHIINLEKTIEMIEEAGRFLKTIGQNGEDMLLVGTKRQSQEVVRQAAERAQVPYVNYRWLGGMLTNFTTIVSSISRLQKYNEMLSEERRVLYTKKELISIAKEKAKLERNLSGIVTITKLPNALLVIDPVHENIAVHEANKMGIPVVAIIDTNGDPDLIDYPIPANDDGTRVIELIVNELVDRYIEGRTLFKQKLQEEGQEHRERGAHGDETRNVAGRKVKVKRISTEGSAGGHEQKQDEQPVAKGEETLSHREEEKGVRG